MWSKNIESFNLSVHFYLANICPFDSSFIHFHFSRRCETIITQLYLTFTFFLWSWFILSAWNDIYMWQVPTSFHFATLVWWSFLWHSMNLSFVNTCTIIFFWQTSLIIVILGLMVWHYPFSRQLTFHLSVKKIN